MLTKRSHLPLCQMNSTLFCSILTNTPPYPPPSPLASHLQVAVRPLKRAFPKPQAAALPEGLDPIGEPPGRGRRRWRRREVNPPPPRRPDGGGCKAGTATLLRPPALKNIAGAAGGRLAREPLAFSCAAAPATATPGVFDSPWSSRCGRRGIGRRGALTAQRRVPSERFGLGVVVVGRAVAAQGSCFVLFLFWEVFARFF